MAENVNNTIKTTVELDANQAQQEIVKLNALASDGTQSLEKRLEAKNKQIKLQNDLNKKNIKDLEKIVDELKGQEGAEKELEKAVNKLNKAKLNEVKVNERNSKTQKKLAENYKKSKSATDNLNKATGGFLEKLKLLAANPIVLVVTAIVGAFTLLKQAFVSNEEGQDKMAKGLAVLNTIFGNLTDIVAGFANTLVDAIQNPQEAWGSFVATLESGYNFVKQQVIDRFSGSWKVLSGNFQSGVLKMRIAWNDFTGDSEESKQLEESLEEVNKKIEEGTNLIKGANGEIVNLYNQAKEAVSEFIDEQEREIGIAKNIADIRAKADRVERDLIVSRSKANRDRAAALENSINKEKFSVAERIAFLKEAGEIEQEITDKEIIAAKLRYNAKVAENDLAGSTKEDLKEQAELQAKIIELETARLTKQKEVTGQIQAFKAEQKAADDKVEADRKKKEEEDKKKEEESKQLEKDNAIRDREAQLELDEIDLQRKRDLGEATLKDELDFLEKKRLQDVSQEGLRQSEIDVINRKSADAKQKIRDLEEKQAKEKDTAILNSVVSSIGEAFGASKEISIAQALINTYKGISEVWSAKSETGLVGAGLVQKIATSAIVASQGFATVKNIVSTNAPGVSGGTGSAAPAAASVAAPAIPTATTTEVSDLSQINQARNSSDPSLSSEASKTASANVQGSSQSNVVFSESKYKDFQNQVTFKENKSTL